MVRKLAIDWDESELRMVAAQCSGRSVKVTDAAVIPVSDAGVLDALKSAIARRGLEDTETLVAIGRGKAELRELQLPPVPDDELPDMVRFQAIRSFASAGDSATVDYLVTNRGDSGIEMIAAAVGPTNLTEIRETCEAAKLTTKRISLRPLAAAALYLINHPAANHDTVLIDLLADDAEIVVARSGRVIFVRTVRMPSGDAARGRALAGELRRSLVACGSSGSLDRVVLWGRQSVHANDVEMLTEASGCQVEVVDPFSLVDVSRDAQADLPDHVGRLAPLVGLLAADESDADRLVDFLNPRQRVEESTSPYRKGLLIGIPIAAALLLAFSVYRQMKGLDQQIADLKAANAAMKPKIDMALTSIERTETVDKFLDGDVNWLKEVRRMATLMPPSDELIVSSISGTSDPRNGGGTLKLEGAVTHHSVKSDFEEALRDESHRVEGDGATNRKTEDAYRWGIEEKITIVPSAIRNDRYAALTALTSGQSPDKTKQTADAEPPPKEPPPDEAPPVAETPEDESSPAQPANDGAGDEDASKQNPDEAELASEGSVEVQS